MAVSEYGLRLGTRTRWYVESSHKAILHNLLTRSFYFLI